MSRENTPEYRKYMREYMARRYERRVAEVIVLLGGKCVKCGDDKKKLQFDHVDPSRKTFTITARLAGISVEKLKLELEKCQLLCVDCHMIKSVEESGKFLARGTHGTVSAYRYCGPPKCFSCRAANSENARKWKLKNKRGSNV